MSKLNLLVMTNRFNLKTDEIERKKTEIEKIEEREQSVIQAFEEIEQKREANEVITEEEVEVLERNAKEISDESEKLNDELKTLEEELEEIRSEIDELNTKTEEVVEKQEVKTRNTESKGGNFTMKDRFEMRGYLENIMENDENSTWVRSFAEKVQERAAFVGEDTLVPVDIAYAINVKANSYSNRLFNEVDARTGKGKTRTYASIDPAVFVWAEKRAASQEVTLKLSDAVELDAFLLSGYTSIYNYDLDNSVVDLAELVVNALAEGFVLARENAILNGDGAASKQPEGILNNASVQKATAAGIKALITAFADLGDDNLGYEGEAIAVMNPKTYKKNVVAETLTFNSSGAYVAGVNPALPDGTRVVLSFAAPVDKVVYGVFRDYLYREIKEMEIKPLYEIKALENQTVIKLDSWADGKVKKPENFMVIDFTAEEETVTP